MKEELLKKIEDKTLKVGVIGLGYVGLPLAVEKAAAGFTTKGFDIQSEKVDMVNKGHNYIGDVVDDKLESLVASGKLSATTDFSFIKDVDFIAICVPTPLDKHKQPYMEYLKSSSEAISKYLKPGTIVVLESTTYPGTTEEFIKPILEKGSGLKCGVDFYLGFSPERVDPGNLVYKTKNTPKVVGGIGKDATEVIASVYRAVLDGDICEVSSPAIAEMEKILENTYRNINIALVNELAMLCDKMNINVWEVIDAAKTKPYGFQPFYPGPGLGGHCIPLDPPYLAWKAKEYDFHFSMIEAAAMINDRMPEYCIERVINILNKNNKSLKDSNILLLGVAYKSDIDDCRESSALEIIKKLEEWGANVKYYDAWIPKCKIDGKIYESQPELTEQLLRESDIVIITTAHSNVDYQFVSDNAKLIFDTRNATKSLEEKNNIEVL